MDAPGTSISAPLRRFVETSVPTVEHLEVLLLIQRTPDRSWDAAGVAEYLGLRRDHAATALEALGRKSLLDVRLGETIKYRFNPATDDQRQCVKLLADAWRDNRQAIVTLVTTNRRVLKDFSDAFRLGRDEEDDG